MFTLLVFGPALDLGILLLTINVWFYNPLIYTGHRLVVAINQRRFPSKRTSLFFFDLYRLIYIVFFFDCDIYDLKNSVFVIISINTSKERVRLSNLINFYNLLILFISAQLVI